jgi:hypothetical protein
VLAARTSAGANARLAAISNVASLIAVFVIECLPVARNVGPCPEREARRGT